MDFDSVKTKFYSILYCCATCVFISPAQAGITLNMLTWEGYAPDAQVTEFKAYIAEKYNQDLNFNITYISSADEYFNGIRRQAVDIIAPSHNIIKDERYKLISQGLILPINLDNIPNYSKILPSLQKADYTTENGVVYSVPMVHGPYGLAYNTATEASAPESWSALWDPSYKGRYTLSSDYSEVNIYITALALGLGAENIANPQKLSDPFVENKLAELIANANNMWKGVDTADDLEKNTLAAAWGFSFPELAKRGQVWKMANPKEGTTGWVDGHAITKTLADKPQLKKIAEEWINFTLSDQFQIDVIVRGIGSAPVNASIKNQLTPEEVSQFHLNDPDYFKNNRILWPTLTTRQRNFFKALWDRALKASK
ncbi:ABC transporter substrate-binding protein [Litoribacillus peritrichatus]|uniref:Uncharacterized protein n=1 Tax=Litoribacillus peritrichatus TaxID=718191 RepID=A0ABP7MK31_9GAMM